MTIAKRTLHQPKKTKSVVSLKYALAELCKELHLVAKTKKQFKGRTPDVVVEDGKHNCLFKIVSTVPEDPQAIISEWRRFDQLGMNWWLCIPEDEYDVAYDIFVEAHLRHAKICSWTENEDGTIGFFDLPFE